MGWAGGWQQARQAVVALWRRARPERALAIEAELEETRAEVVAAQAGDRLIEAAWEWPPTNFEGS
ncbi:hypothetical protein [Microbispora sp. CA-102843]|uniref:hypothetical protein n=1 Tax=Microbispora sp. CA-102843 TaxID=3239952 RepID=UPI003D8F32EE